MGKLFIISGVNNSSSVHIDGRNNIFLVLGEGPTQGLVNATITAEATNSVNVTRKTIFIK